MKNAPHPKRILYDRIITAIPGLARLQNWLIDLGGRASAMRWLQALTFLESIIFPVPIDPLLAMVVLAREAQYIRIALITAMTSVLGGIAGWLAAFTIGDTLIAIGWIDRGGAYGHIVELFAEYGLMVILVGAITPLPYKLVVLAGGFLSTDLAAILPFIAISVVGRSIRYGLVAAVVRHRRNTALATVLACLLAGVFIILGHYIN